MDRSRRRSSSAADLPELRIAGRIVIGPYGGASKSSRRHQAFLECDDGARYRLRRAGGHPMRDPELENLDGTHVMAKGRLRGALFIASRIDPDEDEPSGST